MTLDFQFHAVTSRKLLKGCPNIGGLGAHRFYLQECFGGFKGVAGSEGFHENLVTPAINTVFGLLVCLVWPKIFYIILAFT